MSLGTKHILRVITNNAWISNLFTQKKVEKSFDVIEDSNSHDFLFIFSDWGWFHNL